MFSLETDKQNINGNLGVHSNCWRIFQWFFMVHDFVIYFVHSLSLTVSQEHSVQVEWFAATCLTSSWCWMLTANAWNWTGSVSYGRGSKCKAPIHTLDHSPDPCPWSRGNDPYRTLDPYPKVIKSDKLCLHKATLEYVPFSILFNRSGSNLFYGTHSFRASGSPRNDHHTDKADDSYGLLLNMLTCWLT